jgi:hypothetical protein
MPLALILLVLWPAALLMLVCVCHIAARSDAASLPAHITASRRSTHRRGSCA